MRTIIKEEDAMYLYFFSCCKVYGFGKETLDEDFTGWKCPDCNNPVTKDKLYKIAKEEGEVLKVLYDYRHDGPDRGL